MKYDFNEENEDIVIAQTIRSLMAEKYALKCEASNFLRTINRTVALLCYLQERIEELEKQLTILSEENEI